MDKASEIHHLYRLTGVLLLWCGSSIAGATPARLEIDLPNNIDFAATRVLYQGDDATPFATFTAQTVTFTVPFPDIDGQRTVSIINDETGQVIATKSFSLNNGAITSADSETQPLFDTAQSDAIDTASDGEPRESTQPGSYSISASGQLDLAGLGSIEDGSDYDIRESR